MPSLRDTAYPCLKAIPTERDLRELFTPTATERQIGQTHCQDKESLACFLVLLKTFQRLGYFVALRDVPPAITLHVARIIRLKADRLDLLAYDKSGNRGRHMQVIRDHLQIKRYDQAAAEITKRAIHNAAQRMENLADILNAVLEELVLHRYELPGFSVLLRNVRQGRAEVNQGYYRQIDGRLSAEDREKIDRMFIADPATGRSLWSRAKEDPGSATLSNLEELIAQVDYLSRHQLGPTLTAFLPHRKLRQFAAEGKSLNAAQIGEVPGPKRYAIATAYLQRQLAAGIDDLGEMLIKRVRTFHNDAQQNLDEFNKQSRGRTEGLIALFRNFLGAYRSPGTLEERFRAMDNALGQEPDEVITQCDQVTVFADNNYIPFMLPLYKRSRPTLFSLVDRLDFIATTQDTALMTAIEFIRQMKSRRGDHLPVNWSANGVRGQLNLGWILDKWWHLVVPLTKRGGVVTEVNRHYFELCVFCHLAFALRSGDVCVRGSEAFSDYREQLISWQEYEQEIAAYREQIGIRSDPAEFVKETQSLLEMTASVTDLGLPSNQSVRIEKGEPVVAPVRSRPDAAAEIAWQTEAMARMPMHEILDVLIDTDQWVNWSRFFSPISGNDPKRPDWRARAVTTTFCYGCDLGPAQTERCLPGFDRKQLAFVNQRHVTEEKLDLAITEIVDVYNKLVLPRLWGTGKHVSADGMKWDLYEQNLLSEYHIRYGGYGGLGYYHVSDTYIALFSHFIPCGVWEAVYILDGLMKNTSEIQPDTLHGDTQAQSAPVFAMAHLLGIQLMPRIRNWKELRMLRPSKNTHYGHIDCLFTDVADWHLIETMLPDMLRIALSVKAGRIAPSMILRKLGTYSRTNRLYAAFRELGQVLRTVFLLRYLGDAELRRTIQAATNKSEKFNKFLKWVFFGGEKIIAENDREEQRKLVKYNHLVANCIVLHNVVTLTGALEQMERDGRQVNPHALSKMSPYLTKHINRFGKYRLDISRKSPQLELSSSLNSVADLAGA